MRQKKLLRLFLAATLLAAVGIGATLAYFTDRDQAENIVTMGHVDIQLTEPDFPENKKIENVIPGDVIKKNPTVTVGEGSADSYLRVRMEITGLDEEEKAELLKKKDGAYSYLDIDFRQWRESEGYFYYIGQKAQNQEPGVLKAGQDCVLFRTVTIPKRWDNKMTEKSFAIHIYAEAIQADNFRPQITGGIYGWFAEDGTRITPETYKNT